MLSAFLYSPTQYLVKMNKARIYSKDVTVTDEWEGLGVELDVSLHDLIVAQNHPAFVHVTQEKHGKQVARFYFSSTVLCDASAIHHGD
jgi:hypothetical protein